MARLRDKITETSYGLAMPISLVLLPICDGMGASSSRFFAVVDGSSMPISRGSPPTSQ
jgi:hypothetical protein